MTTPNSRPDLSVIIPAHNEGENLRAVVLAVAEAFHSEDITLEIVVVDDGSDEASEDILSLLPGPSPALQVVRHELRRGSGAARKTGARHASGAWHAWIDADQTYDAADLRRLWRARQADTQLVGWRHRETGTCRLLRWIAKTTLRLLACVLWWHHIRDLNSGLRLIPREHFAVWGQELPEGFSCATAATLSALRHGQRIAYLPIHYQARAGSAGSKFHPLRDGLRMMAQIVRLRLRVRTAAKREIHARSSQVKP